MNTPVSVTIGIPAYNEASNIAYLLHDLLRQQQSSYRLESLLVVSDGSTDETVQKAQSVDPRVNILVHTERKGLAQTENTILKTAKSDIVVLINADTAIPDTTFIEKLITPIIHEQADLVAANLQFLPGKNTIEKALEISMKLKKSIYETYRNGNNVYTCHGPARAFSHRLYTQFEFRTSVGEDAYSYLYSTSNNFRYQFATDAHIFVRSPQSFKDYRKQSVRFTLSKKKMAAFFGDKFIKEQYNLPIYTVMTAGAKFALKHPLQLALYGLLLVCTRLTCFNITEIWEVSSSSKHLR